MRSLLIIIALSLIMAGCPATTDNSSDVLVDQVSTASDLLAADYLAQDVEVENDITESDPLVPFAEDVAQALQATMDEFLAFSGDPAVTLAVRSGDGEWFAGASGVQDWETQVEATSDTQFRAGSSTKPYVAVTILQLVDEGLVDLDAPLTDYLPQYPQWEGITTRDLLGMTSGLADYLNAPTLWLDAFFSDTGAMTPEELVAYVADEPMDFATGEKCAYNNTNYVLAGMIIEAVTGNNAVDEITNRVIESLGLEHTAMDIDDESKENLAHGYTELAVVAAVFGIPVEAASFVPEEFYYSEGIIDCTYLFHPATTWTAGAMLTTATDMTRFMRALLRGALISEAALAEMMKFTECELLGGTVPYGLGLMEYTTPAGKAYGHGGLNFGYEAGTAYHPEIDLTLSHMHNFLPEQSAGLMRYVYRVLVDGEVDLPEPCLPPSDFFADGSDGPVMNFRFKGPVNGANVEVPEAGVANIRALIGGEDIPLYGINTAAKRADNFISKRLQIESIAPSLGDEFQLSQGVLNLDLKAFAAADELGIIELSSATPYDVYASIVNVAMTDDLMEITKVCISAVPDFDRPSQVFICDSQSFTPEPGSELRAYASIAMTTDQQAIADYISILQIQPCMCANEAGDLGPCPDEEQ
jgi:D-alanyl-D-alanine carboxypeptidase